jgi:hypothetical protein
MINTRKKYIIKNPVRFVTVIVVCLFLFNGLISNNYKNVYGDSTEVEKLEEFIDEFDVISEEVKEEYYEGFKFLDIPLSEELQLYTFNICKKYDESYMFIMAIIFTESTFQEDVKCKNKTDDLYSIGLMQLNERFIDTFKNLTGIKDFDINNPRHNIEGCIAMIHNLREQWSQYDISDEDMLLAITNSYNLGFEKYKNAVMRKGFYSREYDRKVMKNKIKLETDGGI